MRRWLLLAIGLCWAVAASAVEVGGAIIPDTARFSVDGPELVLNGAGERSIMLFKIYAIGLYLPARRDTLHDVLALKGPKRLLLVIQRSELSGKQIHDYLINRISDGTQQDEMAAMKARMDDLDRIINSEAASRSMPRCASRGTTATAWNDCCATVPARPWRCNGCARSTPSTWSMRA